MNDQQAILAAKLAGEKVVPTVCGMCGPDGNSARPVWRHAPAMPYPCGR